ncbi:FHA domain protein [Labilithrix luteola]|uniref:FHA domain protein n=1 Tax=Labilithrix luteola TaxID=1391654 RepID=A0A0K1PTI2_9BACT|nr:FHA domain-containing protein [Labilithrix luteola]AKU96843.1 FHA domain protein [Labilithrix luteola]
MPVTVLVRSSSEGATEPPSLTFDGPRIVLGRGAGSDVRLPDPSVSLRHATIRATGTEYAIVDEGSTNGTWVGGIRLLPQTPRVVKTGDLIRVGRVWLEVAIGHKAATPDLGLATRDLAFALVRNAMEAVGDDTVVKVRIAEGPDLGVELGLLDDGRTYLIGRAERCDLPLADEDASREHAAITRRGTQVFLRDLASRNGVLLGEMPVEPNRDTLWRPPTMARIGRSVLALDEPVCIALAALEAAKDEPLPEEDAPPAPAPSRGMPSVPPSVGPRSTAPSAAPASAAPPASAGAPSAHLADAPAAPVVAAPEPPAPKRSRRARGWTTTDFAVAGVAIAVIAVSLAGLVWVLK